MHFKEQFYRCFDQKLKWYLLDGGCHFLLIARDLESHDKFWFFERTGLFEKLYSEWKNDKGNLKVYRN